MGQVSLWYYYTFQIIDPVYQRLIQACIGNGCTYSLHKKEPDHFSTPASFMNIARDLQNQ